MKVEDFVNASINTLDNFDNFEGDGRRLNSPVLTGNLNKSGVPDTIVDSVVSADDPFQKFAEITETILSLYEDEEEWIEVTDTQIASEIFYLRNSFIKGIVNEMNYTSYKMKCDDVADVQDSGEVAEYDHGEANEDNIQEVEENGIDARVVYKTENTAPFHEDVQVKSSPTARNRYVRNHITEDKPSADVAVYPKDTDGWDRRRE